MVKIDKLVPIPPKQHGARKYPWERMEVGDSILVTASPAGARSMAKKAGDKLGVKFVSARVEGGVRVWRTA